MVEGNLPTYNSDNSLHQLYFCCSQLLLCNVFYLLTTFVAPYTFDTDKSSYVTLYFIFFHLIYKCPFVIYLFIYYVECISHLTYFCKESSQFCLEV
jgi:hypothetical protein